jgi:hypothetical protein
VVSNGPDRDPDPPRLLARRSEHAYVSNQRDALPHEPEAVSAAVQVAQTREARCRERERRRDAWRRARALIAAALAAFEPAADARTRSDLRVLARTVHRIDERLSAQ